MTSEERLNEEIKCELIDQYYHINIKFLFAKDINIGKRQMIWYLQ